MRTPLLDRIKVLEKLSDSHRMVQIGKWLQELGLSPEIQDFDGGINMFLRSGKAPRIAIASHFDTVPQAPGANDNCSAIVVCLEIAKRYQEAPLSMFGLDLFFFDQEERGLKGSKAFVKEYGTDEFLGLINLEMMGKGELFAIWPVEDKAGGIVQSAFEAACLAGGTSFIRVDQVVMNTADHESFRKGGLADSFSITCISPKDLQLAMMAAEKRSQGVSEYELIDLLDQAPIFEQYHRPTDTHHHLSEESLQLTADTLWKTLGLLEAR